jgi:signal peptidase II
LTLTFLADLATKFLAVELLGPRGSSRPVLGDFLRLTLTYNAGGALGIETGPTGLNLLIVLSCGLIAAMVCYYRSLPNGSSRRPTALGLLIGGALGNLLDRVGLRPGVVDFIDVGLGDVRFWTFNLADSAIFSGAVLLAWWYWRGSHAGAFRDPSRKPP